METNLAGTVRAEMLVDGKQLRAVMDNVLYVPKLS